MTHHFPTEEERQQALLCHLSTLIPLLIIVMSMGGTISDIWLGILFFSRLAFPMICWIIGRKNTWIVHHAKTSLNFQITQTFILLIPFIIFSGMVDDMFGGYSEENSLEPIDGFGVGLAAALISLLFLAIEGVLLLIHVILVFRASSIAGNKIEDKGQLIYPTTYPLTIPFFRTPEKYIQITNDPKSSDIIE